MPVSVEDKALKKMEEDGFFQPTKEDISKGTWDNTKSFHNFFRISYTYFAVLERRPLARPLNFENG
jgi:hypothetical protein